ncbi:MAG: RrF2 family transcriptional regulator [Bradyrhizobium sp.]|jgi:Rrf2 family nitric oxide-sensitive transcriptional repressor
MRLTIHTDYALRLLMYLALKKPGLATIAEIATTYDISKNHLMKVAYKLSVAGYIESVRGRGGGLRLAKPVEAIILGEVVRNTEPDMPLIVQGMKDGDASRALFVARRAMKLASDGFLKALDGYTLGDLIRPDAKLRVLLTISQSAPDVASRSNRVARMRKRTKRREITR